MTNKIVDLPTLAAYDVKLKEYIKNQTFVFAKTNFVEVNAAEIALITSPNTFYNFKNRNTGLTLNFNPISTDALNEYKGQFIVKENNIEVAFPINIIWKLDSGVSKSGSKLTLTKGNSYLYNIINGLGTITTFNHEKLSTPATVTKLVNQVLTWSAVTNATSYNVYYKVQNSGTTYTLLTNTTELNASYSSLIPESGSWRFDFVVTALNKEGPYNESDYSTVIEDAGEIIPDTDNPFA